SLAFNTALDATNFKSQEGAALREKFKQVHLLGVELAQEDTKNPPQMDRITGLEAQISVIQQSSVSEMRALQQMVYPQLNSGALDNTRQQPKPNTEPHVAARTAPQTTSHLSQDNAADIKHDLIALGAQTSAAKQEAENSIWEIKHAMEKKDLRALKTAIEKSNKHIQSLNQNYDMVSLKSSEVAAAREKLKKDNNLQIEMGNIILSSSPDRQKFEELQKKRSNSQKMVEIEMEALWIKANTAS
ncbi:MAG TPA: hypothetical protein PL094_03330, partial [Acinetobacter johnsonii]|nr:hypothetical protein [Acinetobacter johnsonii]